MSNTAIWQFDSIKESRIYSRDDPNQLKGFLICPFKPLDQYNELYNVVQIVCNEVGHMNKCQISCIRADKISSAGVIATEIWDEILTADFIITDVTGNNGNVMFELGVASASREKDNVIIIKEDIPEEPFLFDISAARHIIYSRSFTGYSKFMHDLSQAITFCITTAPPSLNYEHKLEFPLTFNSDIGHDPDWLISPSILHRRLTTEYLEFGSLFVFKNSWLCISNSVLRNFELFVEMQFTDQRGAHIPSWIGISIRNNGVYANFGHLLYLTNKGEVMSPRNQQINQLIQLSRLTFH